MDEIMKYDETELDDISLDESFASLDVDTTTKEEEIKDDDLEGFASCFPEWSLEPEMIIRK